MSHTSAPSSLPADPDRTNPATYRVLLIEDNPDDALLVRKLIRNTRETYSIDHVKSLEEGIQRVRQTEVDLVLLDLTLTDSQGFETFSKLRHEAPHVAIIVMSGLDDETMAIRTVQAGAQDYVIKGRTDPVFLEHVMRYGIERARAETAFNRERDLLDALLDNIPDRIYFKDTKSRFLRINNAVARLFGKEPGEVVGKSDFDLFTFEHAQAAYRDEQEMIRTGQPLMGKMEKETWPDGHVTWVYTTKMPLRDNSGRVVGTTGISRDITARKIAEESLEKANEELGRSREETLRALEDLQKSHQELKSAQLQLIQAEKMQSVGRLAAGVAHEVKNPLAVLSMGISYLSKGIANQDTQVQLVLSDMQHAVQRADTIIKGLLDFSAPKDLTLREESLVSVIDQALTLVRHEMNASGVLLVKEFASEVPTVRMDKGKIEQVLVNLLMNALHAMSSGGTLTLRLYSKQLREVDTTHDAGDRSGKQLREGTKVLVIEVCDTGTGIAPDKLSKIFDPFFTTKPTGKGTGLGLTVTRKIVELHEGAIDIRNRPDGLQGVQATLMLKL